MEFDALAQRWAAAEERRDRRAATTPTILANLHRKKGGVPFKLTDFMPSRRARRQRPEEQIAVMRSLAVYLGGSPDALGRP